MLLFLLKNILVLFKYQKLLLNVFPEISSLPVLKTTNLLGIQICFLCNSILTKR